MGKIGTGKKGHRGLHSGKSCLNSSERGGGWETELQESRGGGKGVAMGVEDAKRSGNGERVQK